MCKPNVMRCSGFINIICSFNSCSVTEPGNSNGITLVTMTKAIKKMCLILSVLWQVHDSGLDYCSAKIRTA